jgi:hypothetical protein
VNDSNIGRYRANYGDLFNLSLNLRNQSRRLPSSRPDRVFLNLLLQFQPLQISAIANDPSTTMAEIKIDKNLFQERLSHFYSAWKADKRSGDALFNGASSILVLMGKTEETAQFQKNNAIHVCVPKLTTLRR